MIFGLFDIKVFTRHDNTKFWEIKAFNPKNGSWYAKSFDEVPPSDEISVFLKGISPDIIFLHL